MKFEHNCRKCGAPIMSVAKPGEPYEGEIVQVLDSKSRDGLCKKCKNKRARGFRNTRKRK